ncbi:copper resistance protein CopC [Mycolicibacterium litorale]|nr:copper resistance protein CopC [Mycolicibacterium litorale]
MRRLLSVAFITVVMAINGTAMAWAHAVREAADPAPDSALSTGPARVSATFNEQLQPTFAAMTVVGPDGNLWSDGTPRVQGSVVSVGLRPLGPTGSYAVNYRVTSADGHVVSGSWSFILTAAGTGAPGPSAAPPVSDRGLPVWPFVAGAAALIAAGAVWAQRRRG